MNSRAPPLLVDDESDYSSLSESEESDESLTSSGDDWPVGLKSVVGERPTKKDYDQVL